jgi:hypothetical protein
MYKDVYLKYLGWMCLDFSADVRKEAVRSIGKLLKVRMSSVAVAVAVAVTVCGITVCFPLFFLLSIFQCWITIQLKDPILFC